MERSRLLACGGKKMLPHLQKLALTHFRQLHLGRLTHAGLRADGWWLADHKPTRNPETPEERRFSAMKYGLREEDYKHYQPGDWDFSGDYPDLGTHTYAHKDPYENWSHDGFRRNFGEPMEKHWDRYRPDRITYTGLEQLEDPKYWVPRFIAIFGTLFAVIYYSSTSEMTFPFPAMPKQYEYDYYRAWPFRDPYKFPIKNYNFEPADSLDDLHHESH